MVQKVGALRSLHGMSIDKAVDAVEYAMVLVKGWPDKERSGIMKALEELKPIAEHNATVYQQAKAACEEFATLRDETHHKAEAAEEALAGALGVQKTVAAEIATARAKLKADRDAFDAEYRTQTAALKAHEGRLNARETLLKGSETAAKKMADDAVVLNASAKRMAESASAKEAGAAEMVAQLRAIVNKGK